MAARPVEISRVLPGVLAAISVAAFVLCAVGAVLWFAGGGGMPGPGDWAALRFTVMQAALSALCSVGLAIPVARALARRRCFCRPPVTSHFFTTVAAAAATLS